MKSGGEWISSIQLENAAMGHPKASGGQFITLQLYKGDSHPQYLPASFGLLPSFVSAAVLPNQSWHTRLTLYMPGSQALAGLVRVHGLSLHAPS